MAKLSDYFNIVVSDSIPPDEVMIVNVREPGRVLLFDSGGVQYVPPKIDVVKLVNVPPDTLRREKGGE